MLKLGRPYLVGSLVLAAAILLVSTSTYAAIIYDFNQPQDYTLKEVMDAGGIRVEDKLFTEWRVTTTVQGGGLAPGADAIKVRGAFIGGEYGLQFNGPWSAGPNDLADTTIAFKVTADAPWLIHDNTLYTTAFGAANGGLASITENVYDSDPQQNFLTPLANKYVWYISDTNYDNIDHKVFTQGGNNVALTSIWVVKDVVVNGGTQANGSAHVSEFYQTFSQVPEPATVGVLALGASLLLFRRRRG